MLSVEDIQRLRDRFWLYEHEWRYLACYLGEPFVVDDYLMFDDGRALHTMAFSLENSERHLLASELAPLLTRILRPEHRLIHIWGNFSAPSEITVAETIFRNTEPDVPLVANDGEYTIDLAAFNLANLPEARKATRSIENKGLAVRVIPGQPLTARHLQLIEYWRCTRPVSLMGAIAGQAIARFAEAPHAYIIEVEAEEKLRAFSVLAHTSDRVAVNLMSFSEKYAGSRLEDALLKEAIDQAKRLSAEVLHLGYAGTPHLAKFKEKWGARKTGPDYFDATFVASTEWAARANNYDYYWASRTAFPQNTPLDAL